MVRFFDWWAARAISIYPAEFRARFGSAMAAAFHDRLLRHRAVRGPGATSTFAVRSIADLAVQGMRERRYVRRRDAQRAGPTGDTMGNLIQDLRFGARMLVKAPGFTVAAVLVLALGIGSTTAVFGLIDTLFMRARTGQPAGEVVAVYSRDRERPDSYRPFSYPEFVDLRSREGLFAQLSAQTFGMVGIAQGDQVRRVMAGIVTTGFFNTFGAPLALGRDFTTDEERPGADIAAVVLSHPLWLRLGGDPALIGSTLRINSRDFTVVGVAEPGFTGSSVMFGPELWVPTGMYDAVAFLLANQRTPLADRSTRALIVTGQLAPGQGPDAVQARLDSVAADLERAYPDVHERQDYEAGALARMSIGTSPQDESAVTRVMAVLLVLAGVVMLISALNVANMLLARAETRRKELAVRLAVGGSRARLLRQLVTEGLLLSLVAGVVGTLLATWVNGLLVTSITTSMSSVMPAVLNLSTSPSGFVLGMTLVACLVCTVAFTLGPAWRMLGGDGLAALGAHASEARPGRRWMSSALVGGQVALSLMLLTVAGLFVRMTMTSAQADPGFSLDRGVLINIDPTLAGYDPARTRQALGDALDTLRRQPGVEAASLSSLVPFGPMNMSVSVQEAGAPLRAGDPGAEEGLVPAVWTSISDQYFDALGLPMAAGREFTAAEVRNPDARVAIIDEGTAARLFPGQSPVGRFVQYGGANPASPVVLEVVGVAPAIRHQVFDAEPGPHLYTPYAIDAPASVFLHVRTSAPTAESESAMLPALGRALRAQDADLPVLSIQTLPMFRDQSVVLSILRLGAATFVGFGLMALFMAAIGVYGVKAYLVASRTREISIRVTLGANRRDVLGMVLRQGLGMAVAGVVIGGGLSLAMSAAVQGIVLSGGAFDLPVFAGAASVLVAAVLLASWIPARRATRVPATSFMRS